MEKGLIKIAQPEIDLPDVDIVDTEKALLNILDDYSDEKLNSDNTQRALLNILDDYTEEKVHSENTQRALLNILDDFSQERQNSDNTQTALLNILDDYRAEKEAMEDTQRAFLNILEDYSEEKTRAEVSNENLINANKENKELEQFAFVASHDLQEPLRTITNFVELLSEKFEGNGDPETQEFLGYIVNGAAKMQNLIRDLLELSRIGNNSEFKPVNLQLVLQSVIADLDTAIKQCGAKINAGFLPNIRGNENELKRLFQNLISNGIKFRKKDTPLTIHISAVENKAEWVFAVRDNGIGIDEKYREKIFVIFQRLHTVEEYPGTGIGLASCKKIVSLHNGKISVESKLGEGAAFYFTIAK
ncbi:sensor histidine kinase [Mucilaginibacter sp.]|uniref:sensor histidine kinase n=1 Tax=Mucilaginibacter sp. TaxID=1882438 RepID=UPI003D10F924